MDYINIMTDEIKNINEIVYFYKIVSKDNIYRYVGKTINFHKRLAQHIQASYDNNMKTKLYKTIRNNNYWWNFDMILVDTKYNITNIQVQDTEQYYIDLYDCNLNSYRAKKDKDYYEKYRKQYAIKNADKIKDLQKLYRQLNNATIKSINLIKEIINYNDNSSDKVKLYYNLLNYLQIDLKRDYDKNILNHYVIDNSKKIKFLIGFKNDILNDDFINYINNILLPDYNNNHKVGLNNGRCNYKNIEIKVLDINNLKEIKQLISHYLKHINLYIDYGHSIKNQSKPYNSLQFTIQRYNKNIMLNYPNIKVKFIHYLQEEQIIIYKDNDEIETINDNIIIKPTYNIGRHNVDRKYYDKNNKLGKYYDKNNKLSSELYMSYNNNEVNKKRRFYNKYYDDTKREKIINFINKQVKLKPLKKYIKTDYQNQYYNDIIPDNFDKMNNVLTELLKTDDDLIIINN